MICDFSLRNINKILFHFLFIFLSVLPLDTWAASAAETQYPVVGTIVVQGRLRKGDEDTVRAAMPFEEPMRDLFRMGKKQPVPYAFYSKFEGMHVTLAPMGKKEGSPFSGRDSETLADDLFFATTKHEPYPFSLGNPHFFVHLLTDKWATLRQDDGYERNLASLKPLVGQVDYGYFVLPLKRSEGIMNWTDFAWFEHPQNPFCIQRQTEFNPHITIAQVGVRNKGGPFIPWTESNVKDMVKAFMSLQFRPEGCDSLCIDTLRLTARGGNGAIVPLADRSLSGKGVHKHEENMYQIFGRPGERSEASAVAAPIRTPRPAIPTPTARPAVVTQPQQRVAPPVAPKPAIRTARPALLPTPAPRPAGNSQARPVVPAKPAPRPAPRPAGNSNGGASAADYQPYLSTKGNLLPPSDNAVLNFLLKQKGKK